MWFILSNLLFMQKEKMDPLHEILQTINNGTTTYKPLGNSEEEMKDFQSVVKLLQYAEKKGFVGKLKIHTESRTRHSWNDLVFVQGGLTYEGLEYINNKHSANSGAEEKIGDVIELKPNFYGIGMDLRAFGRWLKKKIKA